MPRAGPADVLKRTRQEANRYATQVGRKRLRRLLERAQADLVKRLNRAERLRGPGPDSFTAEQLRVTLAQVRQVLVELAPGFRGLIARQGKEVAESYAAGLLSYMQQAERKYRGISATLPLREASMVDRVAQRTEASVLRRIASSPEDPAARGIISRYGMNVVQSFEDELQLGFATRKPWSEVRSGLIAQSSFLQAAPASWAERIVRTETMAAAGRAAWESTRQAQASLGDMVKILSASFDGRTAWDSYQVHGQIRRPEEAFEWKGGSYQYPPNRPNDREVAIPHRISWSIPDYLVPVSDGEVAARFAEEGRKGSPGGRPSMSTVDRAMFGRGPADPKPLTSASPRAVEAAGGLSKSDYLKSGMRSLAPVRKAFEGVSAKDATRIATGRRKVSKSIGQSKVLPPVKVAVEPGKVVLVDGRHRMVAASEAGATMIGAVVKRYDEAGRLVETYKGPVKI